MDLKKLIFGKVCSNRLHEGYHFKKVVLKVISGAELFTEIMKGIVSIKWP